MVSIEAPEASCEEVEMSSAVQGLILAFDRLTPEEQHEATCEILRRARELDLPPLDDETIDRIAAETFREYDAREAADGES